MDSVAELEAQLKEAKARHAIDAAKALDHGVPWINQFFRERAELMRDSVITQAEWLARRRTPYNTRVYVCNQKHNDVH